MKPVSKRMFNTLSALLAVLALCPLVANANTAGQFQAVVGSVQLTGKDGALRAAQKGGELLEGDKIVTGDNALAQIKLTDGGYIAVRANTELVMDQYSYAKGAEKPSMMMSLVKGGMRSITGAIGQINRDGYAIVTPTATIGIRGTDHEPMVILPPPPGQESVEAPGTYDKVNSGRTFLRTPAGIIEIAPKQIGFTPAANVAPTLLPREPSFYRQQTPGQVANSLRDPSARTVDKTGESKGAEDNKGMRERAAGAATVGRGDGILLQRAAVTDGPIDDPRSVNQTLLSPSVVERATVSPSLSEGALSPSNATILTVPTAIVPTTATILSAPTAIAPTAATILSVPTVIAPTTATILTAPTTISPTTTTAPKTSTTTTSPTILNSTILNSSTILRK